MVFSSQLPTSCLIQLCRTLRHYQSAGLTLPDAFRHEARKGPAALRPPAERVLQALERGDALEDALRGEQAAFPPLFVALVTVGEQSGNLPEVCGELERHYTLQQRLRRQFWSRSAWPLFQLVAAVFVIAALLWILGLIAGREPGAKPLDPLGLGLTGAGGAAAFLGLVFASLAILIGAYFLASRVLRHKAAADRFLLRLPGVGPWLRAQALARFCTALRLTLETGMPVAKALGLSLRATGNAAFEERTGPMQRAVKKGRELTQALGQGGPFPEDFRATVAVGEESGQLPEVLLHQAGHYQEEAERRLTLLTRLANWGVWLLVALLIIFLIFRIVATAILPSYSA